METETLNLVEELNKRREIILRELKRRTIWFIQLRWFVPPAIFLGTVTGRFLGAQFDAVPLAIIAVFMLAYNTAFYLWSLKATKEGGWKTQSIKVFTYCQVVLDYAAMFLLIHFTGGAASPLIFFFIFHIIFASILLPPRSAYSFAALAAAGMGLIAAAEYLHWISGHPIFYQGRAIDLAEQPFHIMVELGFFTASVFITAYTVTSIMPIFRKRIQNLAELSDTVVDLNTRLNALYVITRSISTVNRFQQVLDIVTAELASVMNVMGVSIKLLSEDGRQLYYASASGLPPEFTKGKVVDIDKSPVNRRIIEGEPFLIGNLSRREMFQFGEDLSAIGIKSALFVSLTVEKRVLGILGAYSPVSDHFGVDELDFFRLAAGLVSVALENARAFEALEKLDKERLWFMMRVAHNLRAPLNANQSVIGMILGGFMGEINEDQRKYLQRISERTQAMITTLNELMVLAETRHEKKRADFVPVDFSAIVEKIRGTFVGEAAKKEINFVISPADNLPRVMGEPEAIEQLFENLVSNAIKYTKRGGRVSVSLSRMDNDKIRIEFGDSGIGIPEDAMPRLFSEFFRADNARQIEEIGTGLGLAIVKDIVTQHHGRISVNSKEGQGTTFTVIFPAITKPDKSEGS